MPVLTRPVGWQSRVSRPVSIGVSSTTHSIAICARVPREKWAWITKIRRDERETHGIVESRESNRRNHRFWISRESRSAGAFLCDEKVIGALKMSGGSNEYKRFNNLSVVREDRSPQNFVRSTKEDISIGWSLRSSITLRRSAAKLDRRALLGKHRNRSNLYRVAWTWKKKEREREQRCGAMARIHENFRTVRLNVNR